MNDLYQVPVMSSATLNGIESFTCGLADRICRSRTQEKLNSGL